MKCQPLTLTLIVTTAIATRMKSLSVTKFFRFFRLQWISVSFVVGKSGKSETMVRVGLFCCAAYCFGG